MGVIYTGGLRQIRAIGRILGAGGSTKAFILGLCCNFGGVWVLWGPWEPGNGSVTGQALHAGGEGDEA